MVVNSLTGGPSSSPFTFKVSTSLTLTDSDGDRATLTFGGRPGFGYFKTLGFTEDAVQRLHTTLVGTGTGITLSGILTRGRRTDGIVTPLATQTLSVAAGTTFRSTINARRVQIGPLPQTLIDDLLSASNRTLVGVLR